MKKWFTKLIQNSKEKEEIKELKDTVYITLKASTLHKGGIGVFAIRDIPKGTDFTRVPRDNYCLKNENFLKLPSSIRNMILDRTAYHSTEKVCFFHPNSYYNIQALMNHSSKRNSTGRIALRDIKAGEEVTEDYAELLLIKEKYYDNKKEQKKAIKTTINPLQITRLKPFVKELQ